MFDLMQLLLPKFPPEMAAIFFFLWIVGFMSRMQNLSAENAEFKMADGGARFQTDRTNVENQQETDDEKLERQYFWKVVEAFLYYK